MNLKTRASKIYCLSLQEAPLPDAVSYCVVMVLCWPLAFIMFKERLVHRFPWISVLISCFVVVLLIIVDLGIPLYHTSNHTEAANALRPAYTTHTLLVCYVFLPLTENIQAFILGLVVTLCHLTVLGTVTYYKKREAYERVSIAWQKLQLGLLSFLKMAYFNALCSTVFSLFYFNCKFVVLSLIFDWMMLDKVKQKIWSG
jgi:hypothetical protein